MRCSNCGTENRDDAKFCKGCGASMVMAAPHEAPMSMVACPACGTSNRAGSKFCAKCGTSLGQPGDTLGATPSQPPASTAFPRASREPEPVVARPDAAAHPAWAGQPAIPRSAQKIAGSRKAIYISIAIAVALVAIGGGSYFVIQQREQQKLAQLEQEKKAQAEREAQQRALAAAEEARRQAEEQAAKLAQEKVEAEAKQKEMEAQRREAEMKQREADVKRQAAEVQRREAEAKRMEQEARDRQALAAAEARNRELARAQQEAMRRAAEEQQRRAAAAVQPPRRTAQELCSNQRNFITRGICEARECQKPEHQNEARCRQIQESAARQRQQSN